MFDVSRAPNEQATELANLLRDGGGLSFGSIEDTWMPDMQLGAPSLQIHMPPPLGAPPAGPPPAGPPPVKKRKTGVDGLASAKNIKSVGGSVTIYTGYSAVSSAPQKTAPDAAQAVLQEQIKQQQATQNASAPGREGLSRQLPEGWEMKKSRSTGKVYYINEKLGTSQFEPPQGSTVKVEAKKKQKTVSRKTDAPQAIATDKAAVFGVVRAGSASKGRWAKWNKCNEIVHAEDPEDEQPEFQQKTFTRPRRRMREDDD